jgi:hypothetical protein
MTKIANPRRSVLQDWVMELPLREQGTLLTCVRGCDLTPKMPLNSVERRLVGALRHAFMVPADPREVDVEPGSFFVSQPPTDWKVSELGHYPQHWLSHVMHSAEVIGFRHPDETVRARWYLIYTKIARSLHLNPETRSQFEDRLSEDRIASGEVVS